MRLIPPQHVKPFVKRGNNDRNDAEAMDLSARDLLVRQRTQVVNAVCSHAAEFGVIAAKGIAQIRHCQRKSPKQICRKPPRQPWLIWVAAPSNSTRSWQRTIGAWLPSIRPTRSASAWRRPRRGADYGSEPGAEDRAQPLRNRASLRRLTRLNAALTIHRGQPCLGGNSRTGDEWLHQCWS